VLWASRLRDWRRLERIPVGDWTRRLSGQRTFERFWLPLLRSKLGESWRETSAAFLWATIQRLYAARRQGIGRERFGFVPGGYARILSRFAELLVAQGVVLKTSTAVARVVAEPGGGVRAELASGAAVHADRAVVTLAAPLAARLVPGLSEEERRRCEQVRYLGIVCASVLLDAPLSGFYVTNIVDPGFPFTGVIEMSALVDPERFLAGHHLVYLPRYVTPEDDFFELSDPEIEARFVAGLERMFPGFEPSRIRAFRISRVRQVCAIPTLGYSEHLPPTTTQVPGVHLLGSAHVIHGTLNVNETVKLAEEALATWLA
jgi:protoporphyrinogen oxidase